MIERTVTIFVRDDGTVDIARFADVEELGPVKTLIDQLRKENGTKRRENEKLSEQVTTLELNLEDANAAQKAAEEALKTDKKAEKNLAAERDAVILERDELKGRLEAYSAFGTVDALAAEREDAKYGRDRRVSDRLTTAAKMAQLNPDAVTTLRGLENWHIEYRDVETQDKYNGAKSTASVPFVIERDAEGKETRAVPFRDKVLADFAPLSAALVTTATAQPSGTAARPQTNAFNPSAPATPPIISSEAFSARDPLMVDAVAMPNQQPTQQPGTFYNPENAMGDALREQFGQ